MSGNVRCENNDSYQKFSCVINNSNLNPPHTRIDITKDTPRLRRLRKNAIDVDDVEDTISSKRLKVDSAIDDIDSDSDQCGNLKNFVVYDEFMHVNEKEQQSPNLSTFDQEYEDFIKNLSQNERDKLKQTENELIQYAEANTKPLKYQIITSKADNTVKLQMLDKLHKLSTYDKTTSEYNYELTTLNQLLKIPWGLYSELPISKNDNIIRIKSHLSQSMSFLESITHGQYKAKSKLLLEVSRYLENPSNQGFILGIKGVAGSGKTTLISKGLSKVLNRPFFRVDLGGAKHSDSLFGTRKVFDRSDVGDLVKILIDARCMDPIIFFDELDKVSTSEYGHEFINALNDLTDYTRNNSIMDQYLGIPLDLSRAIIVFAYNSSDNIPETLKSRIHEIEIEAYTTTDKIIMTNQFFIPKSCNKLNVNINDIKFTNDAIKLIIYSYTNREAGVRELERKIDEIILKINWIKLTQNADNSLVDCYCKNMSSTRVTFPMIITKKIVMNLLM